jgi:hypothetical protein
MKTGTDRTDGTRGIRDAGVVTWRRRQLLDAGFGLRASESLARDCGFDLHALLDLVERGCPPRLAVRSSPLWTASRDAADRARTTRGGMQP